MHVRTSKLAIKKIPGLYHVPRLNRGGSEKGERAGLQRRRGDGKEKVEGMAEERGRKEGMGNSDGGNCATTPRGDRRHCLQTLILGLRCPFHDL